MKIKNIVAGKVVSVDNEKIIVNDVNGQGAEGCTIKIDGASKIASSVDKIKEGTPILCITSKGTLVTFNQWSGVAKIGEKELIIMGRVYNPKETDKSVRYGVKTGFGDRVKWYNPSILKSKIDTPVDGLMIFHCEVTNEEKGWYNVISYEKVEVEGNS